MSTPFYTNALNELCSKNQLNQLIFVDCFCSQDISHYVSLSQVMICGDQSSEKNSILKQFLIYRLRLKAICAFDFQQN